MRAALLILTLLFRMMVFPAEGRADLTAHEIIALAQEQLTVSSEFALGEMKVYRGERLDRSYSFVLGKLWDEKTQTEYVRVDFKTANPPSFYSGHRYLLRRASNLTQWLYLPALGRARAIPFRSGDPLLQSDYLFYDLTPIQNFGDYRYRLIDPDEQAPVIEGEPQGSLVPYQKVVFSLERRGGTYIVTEAAYAARGKEKQTRFSEFTEIASGRYRPQKMVIVAEGGRTEFAFSHWALSNPEPQLFTPAHLETKTLTLPEDEKRK